MSSTELRTGTSVGTGAAAPAGIPRWWTALSAIGAVVVGVPLGLLNQFPPGLFWALLSFGAVPVCLRWLDRRPVAVFGLLFGLATLERPTIALPFGSIRMEQPAALAVILTLIVWRGRLALPSLRPLVPAILATIVFLVPLTLSSALIAPEPTESLKFAAWTTLSMALAPVGYLLTARSPSAARRPIVASGVLLAAAGIAAAVAYYLVGPMVPGIQDHLTTFARSVGWAWEPNLYAILLATIIPIALDRARRKPTAGRIAAATILLIGMPLGVTRSAWIGLVAGLIVYAVLLAVQARQAASPATAASPVGPTAPRSPSSWRWLAFAAPLLVLGFALNVLLLDPNVQQRHLDDLARSLGQAPAATLAPGATPVPLPTRPLVPTPRPTPRPTAPGDTPTPQPVPTLLADTGGDTLNYRLERVGPALEDWVTSPIIGLGAESYGQRHPLRSYYHLDDHIAIMALGVLYDSGIIGLAGMAALIALVAVWLWRAKRDPARAEDAITWLAAFTVLLIGYQVTNAAHFGLNWLLVGAALAVCFPRVIRGRASAEPASE